MPILTPPTSTILLSMNPSAPACRRLVAHVGGDERELRLAPSAPGRFRPEVEFMVAGHESIGRRQISQGMIVLRALVDAGEQRRREHVAGMDIDDIAALGALGLDHGIEPGEAAASVLPSKLSMSLVWRKVMFICAADAPEITAVVTKHAPAAAFKKRFTGNLHQGCG